MSKKLVLVLAIAIVAVVAQNLHQSGKLAFLAKPSSPEAQEADRIEARLDAAKSRITAASRAAGVSGMDMTQDVAAAMADLEKVEEDAKALKERSKSEEIQGRCARIAEEARRARGD